MFKKKIIKKTTDPSSKYTLSIGHISCHKSDPIHFYTPVEGGSYYVVPSIHPITFHVRSITLIVFKIFS